MTLRSFLLWSHRWLGLIVSMPLLLAAGTGALLVFQNEIQAMLHPSMYKVQPGGQALSAQVLIDDVGKVYPVDDTVKELRKNRVVFVSFAGSDRAVSMALRGGGRTLLVDPYTGKVLGQRVFSSTDFFSIVHQLHTRFYAQKIGGYINGSCCLVLIILGITGVILWWRTMIWKIKLWKTKWRRFNFDFHHAIGIYANVFWIFLGGTGAIMTFSQFVDPFVYRMTGSTPSKMHGSDSQPATGQHPIGVDRAIEVAHTALPGGTLAMLQIPTAAKGTYTAWLRMPGDEGTVARNRVDVDQFTGQVLQVVHASDDNGADMYNRYNRDIHTGDVYGLFTRILACVACVLLVWQIVSGVVMWWPRKVHKRQPSLTPAPPSLANEEAAS